MMLHQPLWLTDFAAYSFQAAAIVIVGSALPSLLHLRLPKARLIYWEVLLASCLLLPLIEPWRPALAPLDGATGQVSINIGPAFATGAGWPFSLAEALLAMLLAGVLFRAVWILLGLRRLRLYRTRSNALSESFASIDEARRLTSVGSPVLLSRELKSPATFGVRSPVVLLPERFFQLPASQQTAIACHELLHVARRDWAWNLLEEFILTLLWFHPALWWVVRNMRLSREQAVDAEVVRRTQSRQAYLSALLEMAQQDLGGGSVPAPLFLHEGQLAQRVALMVKEVSMSRFRLVVTCVAAAAALVLTGGAAVWAFPLRIPAQSPAAVASRSANSSTPVEESHPVPDKIYKVGGEVQQPKLVYSPDPPYTREARKAKLSGDVVLSVVVSDEGRVVSAKEVSKPLGHGLDDSAIKTVQTWKFKPGERDGKPVAVQMLIDITFHYDGGMHELSPPKA